METASELARELSRHTEAFCHAYFPNGTKSGNYWCVGDTSGAAGRSLTIRLFDAYGRKAGKYTDYDASRVMLRICDWVLSHRRLTASTQHNAGALREVA